MAMSNPISSHSRHPARSRSGAAADVQPAAAARAVARPPRDAVFTLADGGAEPPDSHLPGRDSRRHARAAVDRAGTDVGPALLGPDLARGLRRRRGARAWQQLVEALRSSARRMDRARVGAAQSSKIARRSRSPTRSRSPGPSSFRPMKTKADAWTRAPATRVLPTRWWVWATPAGRSRSGARAIPFRISSTLDPDPAALPVDPGDGTLPIDDGIKWMTDFGEAEKVGMGIRLRLNRDQAQGFDFLLVFGSKATVNAPDRTPDLAALLDAHHFTHGLSFVRQGHAVQQHRRTRRRASTRLISMRRRVIARSALAPAVRDRRRIERCTSSRPRSGFGGNAGGSAGEPAARDRPRASLRRAPHESRAVAGDMECFFEEMVGPPLTPADVRLGTHALHRARSRQRTAAGHTRRQAAVRTPSRHVDQSLEVERRAATTTEGVKWR